MIMFFISTLSFFAALAASAELYPTGSAAIWELVNCVRNSDGHQTEEAWRWDAGNPPSTYRDPSYKVTLVDGSGYFWEGKTTPWYDAQQNRDFDAFIMDGVSTNQDGPLGVSTTIDGNGQVLATWAWYGSGYAFRIVGSGYTCNAVYWTMQLPHMTILTSSSGKQGICEYGGSYYDIAQAFGLKAGISSGTSTVVSNLYAQGGCCNGGICCSCSNCGGQLYATIQYETTGKQNEDILMLDELGSMGPSHTGVQSCHWGADQCNQGPFVIGCTGSPPSGTFTAQQARVDIIYGPFSDSTGRYPNNPQGVNPYLTYAISETAPGKCSGATLAAGAISFGAEFFALISAEGPGAIAGVIGSALATTIECAFS